MTIDVCFSPALYTVDDCTEAIVVVTDVFRATTTVTTAFANGARSVRPVATVAEAEAWKAAGWAVGAERNVRRCSFADFGNSPFDYTRSKVEGKELVFTTTNGTKAICCAAAAYRVVAGAFINLQAVADYCARKKRKVIVLCSGWEGRVNMEDLLFGGALTAALQPSGYQPASDSALIALLLWKAGKRNLRKFVEPTEHVARMKANGLENDIIYCLTLNRSTLVPVFQSTGELRITEED